MIDEKICNDYSSGYSLTEIRNKYKIGNLKVKDILLRNNIITRTLGAACALKEAQNRSLKDIGFFTTPSNELAYMMGFSLADGHCHFSKSLSSGRLSFNIHMKDRIILENFSKWLNLPDNIIKLYRGKYIRLSFRHHDILPILEKWGTVPNKSQSPNYFNIETKYIKPFIIGFIDGDGFIKIKPSEGYQLVLASHNKIIDQILSLFERINLDKPWSRKVNKNSNHCHTITLSNKKDVFDTLNTLDATQYFHLPRKWEQFLEFQK